MKQEQRLEMQQELTPKAQAIEDAKRLAEHIRKNSPELQLELMKKQFAELIKQGIITEQEIEDILKKS